MASRKLLPVTAAEVKLIADELRKVAEEYDLAAAKMKAKSLETVEVFGFPTVVTALQRTRNFVASVIGQTEIGAKPTDRLSQIVGEKLKKDTTAHLRAADEAKLKANRKKGNK